MAGESRETGNRRLRKSEKDRLEPNLENQAIKSRAAPDKKYGPDLGAIAGVAYILQLS